jgi:hypothetical protein
MSTCCTIWISGHGYQPVSEQEQTVSMATRSQSTITYDGTLKVFQLSMAGLANVTTEMGIIYKKFKHLKRKGQFLEPKIVKLLQDRSTEYATLTWLVNKIYNNQNNKCEENMVRSKLEQLIEEMLILEKLASINYARFSLPTIIPNPMFNKVYSLKPNPGENTRNESSHRSNPIRTMGDPQYNKLWAFYGIWFLDTSNPQHERFSISNLPVNENGFVDPREIMKRNILTLLNYNTFWSGHLDTRDFSGVPDTSVSDIGDDLETSIAIFKEFCESTGIAKPVPNQSVVIPPHIIAPCIEILQGAVTLAADAIRDAIRQLPEYANIVSDARAEFKRTADLANKAEDQYNALSKSINTRNKSQFVEPALLAAYNTAEANWQQARIALDQAKANDTRANENAQQVENQVSQVIIAAIKTCIDNIIIFSKEHIDIDIRRILKNIIMSNKLKNILKTAIFNKKISSNQIILFFSGLGYKELGIADPACFVAKPLKDPSAVDNTMQLDTQQLYDSSFVPPPLFEDILNFIESLNIKKSSVASVASVATFASVNTSLGGGTKRKRRMRIYSRKRHVRRRKHTRRRRHSRIVY